MNLLEAAPTFVLCSELGGSSFRGTDLLSLAGNQSVPYSLSITEIIPISVSPFKEVPLYCQEYSFSYFP